MRYERTAKLECIYEGPISPPTGRPASRESTRAPLPPLSSLSRISRGSSEHTQSNEREGHAKPPSKPHLARLTAPIKPSVRRPTRFQPAPEPASDRAAERANVGRLKTRTPALVGRLPLSRTRHSLARLLPPFSVFLPRLAQPCLQRPTPPTSCTGPRTCASFVRRSLALLLLLLLTSGSPEI
jgi:hypothetical protein